ncbi:MAG: glycosyltransferase [Firmicutes bacterium]|nr:glycosyltransferase [Bacillota bacterium]
MSKRLLVLSVHIGAGHFKAGEALCKAYTKEFGGEAYHMDFLRYSSPTLGRWVEEAYYLITKHTPSVYKFIYNMAERPNTPLIKTEVYLWPKKYRRLVEEYQPDAVICTHFLPAAVASHMYSELPIPNGVVLTDFTSHPMWVNQNNGLFFVAHDGMRNELRQLGVEDSRICVSGIPISPYFLDRYDSRLLREKLQLSQDLPVILAMSGGNAIGPLVEVLEELSPLKEKVQVVAIAGRNRQSFRELRLTMKLLGLQGRVMGFVDNIHEWMAASDLLISKAGGLTVAEALASGLPMLVIRPTPGQEDGNTEFLTGAGAAIHLKHVSELKGTVTDLLQNPLKLEAMRSRAKSLGRPEATVIILTEMIKMIEARETIAVKG